jgi:hypothetical protein
LAGWFSESAGGKIISGRPAEPAFGIPTGFRLKAQGCEERATLGIRPIEIPNRNAVAAIVSFPHIRLLPQRRWRCFHFWTRTQGRRSRANPGL